MVSCISYDSNPTLNFENQVPNPKLIDSIQFKGGGTDFDQPLMIVKNIATKYLNNFTGFHVCFLSDGQASFPQSAVRAIKANNLLVSKFRITTVAFGNDQAAQQVLKLLAQEFSANGCFKNALAPEQLKNALIEMIPNVYRNAIA